MLTGDNSILKKAGEAKEITDKTNIIEQARLDIMAKVAEKHGANLTEAEVKTILGTYFNGVPNDLTDLTQEMTTKNGGYTVKLSEVLNGVAIGTTTPSNPTNPNTEAPDLLKDYVLGVAVNGVRPGKDLTTIFNFSTRAFINDTETIANASTAVVTLNLYTAEVNDLIIYAKYENVAYRILVNVNYDTDAYTTSDLVKVYEPDANSRVGQVVQYSADGTSQATDWLVLYDNGGTLDIMSLAEMGSYTLGSEDSNATGADGLAKAMNSYENAVSRLNTYCGTLVTNSTAQKVRSVGTQFDIADTTAKYSSTFLAENPTSNQGQYNGEAKTGDMNGEQDVVRMSYYSAGGTGSGYQMFGYATTTNPFWLASRYVYELSGDASFHVGCVDSGNAFYGDNLWSVDAGGAYDGNSAYAVRPVVRVAVDNVSGL